MPFFGWTWVRKWELEHPLLDPLKLHHVPADKQAFDKVQHTLRESMRIHYFQKFLASGRRDAEECRPHVSYLEARCAKARKLCTSRKRFTVMTAGSISPAAYSIMRGDQFPTSCPWCGDLQAPPLEHVAWQCEGLTEVRRQHRVHDIRVSCPMQKRLGWPSLMACDEDIFDWLCYVRTQFLIERY